MDARFNRGFKLGHRTINVGETASNLYLEVGTSSIRSGSDPSKDIAGDQA
jgi:hypothetical protein